eukprot:7991100-Karenia_brevis.AAC.1
MVIDDHHKNVCMCCQIFLSQLVKLLHGLGGMASLIYLSTILIHKLVHHLWNIFAEIEKIWMLFLESVLARISFGNMVVVSTQLA